MISKFLILNLLLFTQVVLHSQIAVRGTVANSGNNVVSNHPIYIKTDSGMLDTLYTDIAGRYSWEFTGVDGVYVIQTVGYCGEWRLYSDTVHLGLNSTEVVDFKVCHQITEESCSAFIEFQKETDRIIFFGSHNRAIEYISYYWDFGDGTYSSNPTPRHEFKEEGVYKVTLTIKTPLGCTASAEKEILASQKSFVRGTLRIPENYLSNAYIWLIGFDNNQNAVVQNVLPDNAGKFSFFCDPNSRYLVKIVPDFDIQTIPRVLPTYLGGATNWQDAQVLDVGHEILSVDLKAEVSYMYLHGFNTVVGSFEYLVSSSQLPLNVLLLDKSLNPIDHAQIKNGRFSFSGLPRGTYYILPECTGKISEPIRVDFIEDFDVTKYSEFKVSTTRIQPVGITNSGLIDDVKIYPIPFNDQLNIETSVSLEMFQLVDMAGVIVLEQMLNARTQASIDVSHLPKGNYILRLFPVAKPPYYQLIVK